MVESLADLRSLYEKVVGAKAIPKAHETLQNLLKHFNFHIRYLLNVRRPNRCHSFIYFEYDSTIL